MQVLVKVLEMEFTDENKRLKDAYLNANKWYATKILSNEKFANVKVEYKLNREECKVKLILYSTVDINEIQDRHCKVCKELHTKVFENEFFNCNTCNLISFYNKIKEAGSRKRLYYRDVYNNKLRV